MFSEPSIDKLLEKQINQVLPYSQDWIMNSMKAMGFKVNDNGICQGLSQVGIRDFLSGNLGGFNKLLELIHKAHYEFGGYAVSEFIQNNPDKVTAEGRLVLDDHSLSELVKAIQVKVCFKLKSYPQETSDAIIRLFNDIARQYVKEAYLNDEGYDLCGIIRAGEFGDTDCFYSHTTEDIMAYFTSLKKILRNTDKPVAMALFNSQSFHCIGIGYNPGMKTWTLIDAECMRTEVIEDERTLAVKIIDTLSIRVSGLFRMQLYCHQNSSLQPSLDEWLQICEINYVRKSILSMGIRHEPEIKSAHENLLQIMLQNNSTKEIKEMNDIFKNTCLFLTSELPYYVTNKLKKPEVLANSRECLMKGLKQYAEATNSMEFIQVGKHTNSEYQYTMNPHLRPKVSHSGFFAHADARQIAQYGAIAVVAAGLLYNYGM